MAGRPTRSGATRIGVFIIIALAVILLVVGGYFTHRWRKRAMVEQALAAGLAAYAEGDWDTARVKLGHYLSQHRQDADVLRKYAEAQLSSEPLLTTRISQAISAYREVFRQDPSDRAAFERLVLLYRSMRDYAELGYVAGIRLEAVPGDPGAIIAKCQELLSRQQIAPARTELEGLLDTIRDDPQRAAEYVEASLQLAEVILHQGANDARQKALSILDEAAGRSTDSALVDAFRAAVLRSIAAEGGPESANMFAQAREAADRAAEQAGDDPQSLLAVTRELAELGEYDRAGEVLAHARTLPRAATREQYVDQLDWVASCFMAEANLCLKAGWGERGVQAAEATLPELKGRRQYGALLPTAVRLFVLGGRVDQARASLDTYVEMLEDSGVVLAESTTVAALRALVANAEGDPYEVIAQLEPLVERGHTGSVIMGMLVDAYARTGQTGRLARIAEEVAGGVQLPADSALQLARSAARRGQWTRALALLDQVDADELADGLEPVVLRYSVRVGQALEERGEERVLAPLVAELRELRNAHPERADVRVVLALALEGSGEAAGAEAELRSALSATEDPLGAYLALVGMYTSQGRPDEALETLRSACEAVGDVAQPWLMLAGRQIAGRDFAAARATLEAGRSAVASEQDQLQIDVRLAAVEFFEGEREQGVARLLELAAAHPDDISIRTLLLQSPEVLDDQEAAQRLVDEIREVEGETGLTWRLGQARVWLYGPGWSQRVPELERLLRYCIEADPTQADSILLLGEVYERQGRFEDAERTYSAGLQVDRAADVIERLLALLQRQQRFEEARDLLDRFQLELGRGVADARRLMLALGSGAQDEAITELKLRASRDQADPTDLLRLATLVYSRDGAAEQALAYLDQAAERGAAPADVARIRVGILAAEDRVDEAGRLLDELVTADESRETLALRAAFWMSHGQPDRAEADYQRIAQLAPDQLGAAMLGEFYAQRGELDQAIAAWEQGLDAEPDSVVLRRGLCKALLLRRQPGDLERMGELLDELRELVPEENVEWLWLAAENLAALDLWGRQADIRGYLGQALTAIPSGGPEALIGLSDLALRLSDAETARALVLRGLDVHGPVPSLRARQARLELLLGSLNRASELAGEVLDDDPGNLAALQTLVAVGRRLDSQLVLEDALGRIEGWLAEHADAVELQMVRAETLLALGRADEAVAGLEQFSANASGGAQVTALLALARIQNDLGHLDEAERHMEAARVAAPDDPAVIEARLRLWAACGQYTELVAWAEAQSGSEQTTGTLLLTAAQLLARVPEQRELVLRLCGQVQAIRSDSDTLVAVGNLQYALGDLAAAAAAYRRALQATPGFPEALNNLAWLLAQATGASPADLQRAREYAQQAVAQRPQDPNYHDTLGTVLSRMELLGEARAAFERVVRLTPADSAVQARALFNVARTCGRLAATGAARENASAALAAERAIVSRGGAEVFDDVERKELMALQEAAQQN